MSGQPTLFLLIGLPGAGKTTLARQLEQHSALRFTPDEWMQPLFNTNEVDGKRWVLESELLWGVAARALTLGVSVVLDYGCWAEEERELFRTRALALGAQTAIYLLDPPLDTLWQRLEGRNAVLPPGTFAISKAELHEWNGLFQRPMPEELARWDVVEVVQ